MSHTRFTPLPHPPGKRSRFLQSLGWLGGVSLLSSGISSGMAIAQAATPQSAPVPSAEDLLGPTLAPESVPAPVAPQPELAAPQRSPQEPSTASQPVVPSTTPEAIQTVPGAETITIPASAGSFDSPYIDTSDDYDLGATQPYEQPTVVFSERSSGCQAVLQSGQSVPNQLCTAQQPGSSNAITVGPISIGPDGIRYNSQSARDYLNITPRPAAFAGNGNVQLMYPLSIPAAITSVFGWRVHPIFGGHRFHSGTDIGAPMGTPVLAAYAGRVALSDFMQGYGLTVVLQHGDGNTQTLYAHLSEIFVTPGDMVEQGEVIGRVGSTGNSTGPHLHFEVRERTASGWVAVNAGALLENALGNFWGGVQLAQADTASGKNLGIKDLSEASKVAGTASSVLGKAEEAAPDL